MHRDNCDTYVGHRGRLMDRDHDLIVYHYGHEKCRGDHFWTGVRDHYLIHYIISGKGVFVYNNKTYHLKTGQGFLSCPNTLSYYQAHSTEPWEYCWVGFQGRKARHHLNLLNLSNHNPIIDCRPNPSFKMIVEEMIDTKNITTGRELVLTGLLYHFFALLLQNERTLHHTEESRNYSKVYVDKAIDYIEKNYSHKITIEGIADYIGIDRKYLSSLFKDIRLTSPQNFLIKYRMDKACILLTDELLSITHVAHSVGYDDPLLFSKMFKKYKGMPPTQYRKRVLGKLS
ncbi:MAG TPA: AraC family transcriptional regulator [Clostridia bacterium]|nr:AraC family transcriptional regulator [Clostridia bacterium]